MMDRDDEGEFRAIVAERDRLRKECDEKTKALAVERFEVGRYHNLLDELRMDIQAAWDCLPPRRSGGAEGQVVDFQEHEDAASGVRDALASAKRVLKKERNE